MRLKTLIEGLLLVILIALLMGSSSCRREAAKFRPKFYVGDPTAARIINRDGETVSCMEEKFLDYGCLHVDQINQLRRILLKRCR